MPVIPIQTLSHDIFQYFLNNLIGILFFIDLWIDQIKIPFIWMPLPNSVTSNQYIIDLLILYLLDMRHAYHHLLVSRSVLFHFKLKIAQRTRHPQLSIDSVFFYLTPCSFNPFFLLWQVRLMVNRYNGAFPLIANHTTWIAQTCNVNCFLCHQTYNCCTSSHAFDFIVTVFLPIKFELFS